MLAFVVTPAIEPVLKASTGSGTGGGGNPYHSAALDASAGKLDGQWLTSNRYTKLY